MTYRSIDEFGINWASFHGGLPIRNFTFQRPSDLPPGNYLMRGEHFGFYISCAQLTVIEDGMGAPSPTVKIPGVYNSYEPGILVDINNPVPTSYTAPGPATWPSKCEDGTPNLVGQVSDGDCRA
ncbi:hypothetical protein RU639_012818 [Aspergillus parasiticus]